MHALFLRECVCVRGWAGCSRFAGWLPRHFTSTACTQRPATFGPTVSAVCALLPSSLSFSLYLCLRRLVRMQHPHAHTYTQTYTHLRAHSHTQSTRSITHSHTPVHTLTHTPYTLLQPPPPPPAHTRIHTLTHALEQCGRSSATAPPPTTSATMPSSLLSSATPSCASIGLTTALTYVCRAFSRSDSLLRVRGDYLLDLIEDRTCSLSLALSLHLCVCMRGPTMPSSLLSSATHSCASIGLTTALRYVCCDYLSLGTCRR